MSVKSILTVFKREFRSYFFSPIAYIIMTIFLVITGWFFFSTFFLAGRADMRDFFNLLPLIFAFTIPAVTMRVFAEEYRSGSFEILATLPLDKKEIVAGKFFAAHALTLLMIAPTLIYAISISTIGSLDWGPVIGGYLGAILLSGAFTAIGIFASSLTHNQIVAFIISVSISFFLTVIDNMLILIPGFLVGFFQFLGTGYHFGSIAKGVIDSRDIIYFLSVIFIALYSSYLVNMEKK
ncbi:MAG: ABC transporter permease subunit [Spirochaetales bacterium]|nr:ABC transporter permease subunit [Spirochaetales bacterium]